MIKRAPFYRGTVASNRAAGPKPRGRSNTARQQAAARSIPRGTLLHLAFFSEILIKYKGKLDILVENFRLLEERNGIVLLICMHYNTDDGRIDKRI